MLLYLICKHNRTIQMDSKPKMIGNQLLYLGATVLKHFKLTKRLGTGAFG